MPDIKALVINVKPRSQQQGAAGQWQDLTSSIQAFTRDIETYILNFYNLALKGIVKLMVLNICAKKRSFIVLTFCFSSTGRHLGRFLMKSS